MATDSQKIERLHAAVSALVSSEISIYSALISIWATSPTPNDRVSKSLDEVSKKLDLVLEALIAMRNP